MSANKFLEQFGFSGDPFQSTNASEEPTLEYYFVPPPYFSTVIGDSSSAKSQVVLAPRGGGKTAQRLMIERESRTGAKFLCVTYDDFEQLPGFKVSDATLEYHMNLICRLILVGILMKIEEKPDNASTLSNHQKAILKYQIRKFLGSLSAAEFELSVGAIKNFRDKASDFWKQYGGTIAAFINAFIAKYEFDSLDLPSGLPDEQKRDESLRYHFKQLLNISKSLGFESVYVLVDKVDEISITAKDAKSTFDFISSLLLDLPTLETDGVGFKFFLWDQIKDPYDEAGSRPDRVPTHVLNWSNQELQRMLSERLKAYSNGRATSLNTMLCADVPIDLHVLVSHLAAGSPRDMIRVCGRIVTEQNRISDSSDCIDAASIWKGIRTFSMERSSELFGSHLSDLRKINSVTFTINQLANDVFRISTQAARSKIQKWMSAGAVKKIGELPNRGNRPLHLFGVVDLRLAIAMLQNQDIDLVLGNLAVECPACNNICISERTDLTCA